VAESEGRIVTSSDIVVQFVRLRADASAPVRMTSGAAGFDLAACLGGDVVALQPGARARVPTGLRVAIPNGFEGQVRPRSGWADRAGVTVLNAPGTIDADYRGELMVLLVNLGSEAVNIRHGDRIAQLVIAPVVVAEFHEHQELDAPADASGPVTTEAHAAQQHAPRGAGGFGSTGI
jgi:dUTP pyrophosphatase